MKKGDIVTYRGEVLETFENGSVLTKSLTPDGREYSFLAHHLSTETSSAPAPEHVVATTLERPEAPTVVQTSEEVEQAVAIVKGKGYSEEAARKIVHQVGAAIILKSEAAEKELLAKHPAPETTKPATPQGASPATSASGPSSEPTS